MISSTLNFQAALAAFTNGNIIVQVVIEGYSRVFTDYPDGIAGHYPWIVSTDDLDLTLNDLSGGADQRTGGVTVQDIAGCITRDFTDFVFEGKQIQINVGFPGLAQIDYCTVFTGFIDTVSSANANLEYYIQFSDVQAKLAAVVYETGDDGGSTSSTNTKTVYGHPLDILMEICQNLGVPCDTTKIEAYRDGPFAGTILSFNLTQAPVGVDFIKAQLMKPLGGYMWVNAAGLVTVNFFYPLAGPVAVGSFTRSNWLAIPEAGQTDMVNTVQMQFDLDNSTEDSSGDYLSSETENYGPSYALYGNLSSENTIDADGVRSGFQGFFIAALTSRLIFMRYGFKNLTFDSESSGGSNPESFWNTLLYEPGDIVAVTHSQVPDRVAGVLGIMNKLFEIINKTINFTEGKLTYSMIDASYLENFGDYKISPPSFSAVQGGTLEPKYAAASAGDKAEYMFFCNASDEYSNGDPGHILG
jgi:hypothetical protein